MKGGEDNFALRMGGKRSKENDIALEEGAKGSGIEEWLPGKVRDAHWKFVKATMEDLKVAKALFKQWLPPEIKEKIDLEGIKLESGHFIDPKLRGYETDMLYSVPILGHEGEEVYVYLLFEHKSYVDYGVLDQLFSYMEEIYRGQGKEKRPVFPIVMYHGQEEWGVPRRYKGLFKGYDEGWERYLVDFEYVWVDVKKEDLKGLPMMMKVRIFLMVLERGREMGRRSLRSL